MNQMFEFRYNLALTCLLTNLIAVSAAWLFKLLNINTFEDWIAVAVYVLCSAGLAGLGKTSPAIGDVIVKK